MNDNDGEFILIEAAEVLPKWANPESAENRVSTKLLCCLFLKGELDKQGMTYV